MGFLGFKQLFKNFDGKLISPLHHAQQWAIGENIESHHRYTYALSDKYDNNVNGRPHCDQCGFHSYKRPEFMEDYSKTVNKRNTLLTLGPMWCVVDNNGFVVEHELGYRATHSKLIFATPNHKELLEWCNDELADHMPGDLIEWCQADTDQKWKMMGDHFNVVKNYLTNWLENGRDAYLIKPEVEEYQKNIVVRGWGKLA